jgi:DNA-binding CsgD family transcriptional regulator
LVGPAPAQRIEMYTSEKDLAGVHRLWSHMAGFPAGESEAALLHLLKTIADLLGGTDAFWVGATRLDPVAKDDKLHGWRPRGVRFLHHDDARDRVLARFRAEHKSNVVDPQTAAMLARAGQTRACLRADLLDDKTWNESALYREVLQPLGVEDRLLGCHVVSEDAESYIGVDRGKNNAPFGERERDLLKLFLLGSTALHRDLMRSRGLIGAELPLSPREQDVQQLLLTSLTEEQIAVALGLTPRTTHQYVVAILRKWKVSGRVGLMARWLRRD